MKNLAKHKNPIRQIDGLEMGTWIVLTIIYVIFMMMVSGAVEVYLPEIIYVWGIPLNVNYGSYLAGIAIWGVISILLQYYFKNH